MDCGGDCVSTRSGVGGACSAANKRPAIASGNCSKRSSNSTACGEQLEAKFLTKAGASGKPRGLRWADCEFENDVTYARDRQSGVLSAFVAVRIKFEAIAGGGMEEVEAVDNAKYATAVFYFDPKHRWMTEGRAIFNLNPHEAVRRFEATLEPIGPAHRMTAKSRFFVRC